MALFSKNWKQIIVSLGEPFQIEYLDRKFNGRSKTVFKVDDVGAVLLGGRHVLGDPKFTYGGSAGAPSVSIKLRDTNGNGLARLARLDVWVSATAGGTPIGTDTTGLTTTVTAGTIALTKLANLDFELITTKAGLLTVVLTDAAGATTRFVNAMINGRVYSSKAIISPP